MQLCRSFAMRTAYGTNQLDALADDAAEFAGHGGAWSLDDKPVEETDVKPDNCDPRSD